jgi:hypothetical protein
MKHSCSQGKCSDFLFFLKYFGLFFLLFVSLALAALTLVLKEQADPFFYARF